MSFAQKLGKAEGRAKNEARVRQEQSPEPKTAGDLQTEDQPAGWTRTEMWERAWPLVKPVLVYAGVLGYTATWWVLQAGMWVTVAHAAAAMIAAVVEGCCWSWSRWLAGRLGSERCRVLIGATTAVVWLVVALSIPMSLPWCGTVIVAGWLLMLGLSARYYHQRRPGYPDEPPPEVTEQPVELPEIEPDPGGLRDEWDRFVAAKLIPGSTLQFLQTEPHTYSYALHLSREHPNITAAMVPGKLGEIAHALGVSAPRLMIEPDLGKDASPTQLEVKYVHTSPLADERMNYDQVGPLLENGEILLGPYADAIGEARIGLYADGGMWSTYVAGGTGSGKSRVAEAIGIAAVSDPLNFPTVLLFVDPQEGASSQALLRGARKAIPGSEMGAFVEALSELTVLRQAQVSLEAEKRGQSQEEADEIGFVPIPCSCGTTDEDRIQAMVHGRHQDGCGYKPGILVIIDESHRILADPNILKAVSDLSRETRKLGIAYVLLSQAGTLEGGFGGGQGAAELRGSLQDGNTVALASQNKMNAQVLGFGYDVTTLPRGGYLVTSTTTPGHRPVMARCRAPVNPDNPRQSIAGRWLAKYPKLGLAPAETYILADWLSSSAETSAVKEQVDVRPDNPKLLEYVRRRSQQRLGMQFTKDKTQPKDGESKDTDTTESAMPHQSRTETAVGQLYIPSGAEVIAEAEAAVAAEQARMAAARDTDGLRPGSREHAREQVLEQLVAGVTRTSEIAATIGFVDRYVRDLLGELEQAGQARPTGRGQWTVVS